MKLLTSQADRLVLLTRLNDTKARLATTKTEIIIQRTARINHLTTLKLPYNIVKTIWKQQAELTARQ